MRSLTPRRVLLGIVEMVKTKAGAAPAPKGGRRVVPLARAVDPQQPLPCRDGMKDRLNRTLGRLVPPQKTANTRSSGSSRADRERSAPSRLTGPADLDRGTAGAGLECSAEAWSTSTNVRWKGCPPCWGMPEAGRGLGGVAVGKVAGGSTVVTSAQQNRGSQKAGTVLVQVHASGAVHGCPSPPASGPGGAARNLR